eukprot:TRINITY_DN11352_c0_g1_i1.p1 TRINITY_DN11352_c0_g1~~TRINITY_DN11352_c0_g1_i1.p1  ORF type:complete len:261 (-),score=50.52 TRINITY_DN11352_c0_g1_i1:14-712(-)
MAENKRIIKGIIFDLDGLLLDTEPLYEEAIQAVLTSHDEKFTYTETLRSHVVGRGEHEGASLIISEHKLPVTPQEFLDAREIFLKKLFPTCKHMPGAVKLTTHLHKIGIPIAIATSSIASSFKLKTAHHQDWLKLFNYVITGDDPQIKKGKPSPDIFLAAAKGINVPPENCIVFEDSPAGTDAGHAAGCFVVSVPTLKKHPEKYKNADLMLNSLEDFKPEDFGFQPYPTNSS